jgi:cell division protein FtsL
LALAERNAYHQQRDQAFRKLDEVTAERNQLNIEVERLKRQIATLGSSRARLVLSSLPPSA